ncbi:helix-turn-helix transcriptional regulator [Sphingobium sp. CR2-8]|uniref:helix-turn-helix domain-containing protein n=1 Tax=Sphingobium sp. CR2-8 TaxID=1306534 RepID=UPI002DB8FDDF|nr:helix-turn-helix transcriptional regulator [Sphingobium sp. CR2-8]MEC3911552.1 helix-turn-helix transcriptional regulator [Sphingobium sp. CR2-8]
MAQSESSHKRINSSKFGTVQSRKDREGEKIAFAQRLSFLIKRLDLNDAELSRRSGLPRNTISRYRNAESLPEARHLFTVARVLDVDAEWLITGEGSATRVGNGGATDEEQLVNLFNALDDEAQQFMLQTATLLWSRPARG